jgi:hypothetical protein
MKDKGKSGTIAGSVMGLAAALMLNLLTAAPPEQRTAQAGAPAAIVQPAAQGENDPCKLPELSPVSLKATSVPSRTRSAS